MGVINEEVLKTKNGQAGPDGNPFVRNRRIEMRVSPKEHAAVYAAAIANGFASVAQYVREQAIQSKNVDSPISRRKALLACQYELNRIGNNVNQIARQLNQGHAPDEEMLLVLLQIQELAHERLQSTGHGTIAETS